MGVTMVGMLVVVDVVVEGVLDAPQWKQKIHNSVMSHPVLIPHHCYN